MYNYDNFYQQDASCCYARPHCDKVVQIPVIVGPKGDKGEQGIPGTPGTITSPLILKGDIFVFGDTGNTRLPVGPNGSLLRSNSTTPTGYDFVGNIDINVATGNAFLGQGVKFSNSIPPVTGVNNTGFGVISLASLTTGFDNTAHGHAALTNIQDGTQNVAIGSSALAANISGSANVAVGYLSLANNIVSSNTAVGSASLQNNTTGTFNAAFGNDTLNANTIGNFNVAVGSAALSGNTTGVENIGVGPSVLTSLTTGTNNIGLGNAALSNLVSGSLNIGIGTNAGSALTGIETNNIIIGANISGLVGLNNSTYIGNIFGTAIADSGLPVFVDNTNKLGTAVSSIRFKENVQSLDINDVTSKLTLLNPVSFTYKTGSKTQFGLIAEEVEKAIPEIVVYQDDENGESRPFSVRYDAIIPLLLSEVKSLRNELTTLRNELADLKNTSH